MLLGLLTILWPIILFVMIIMFLAVAMIVMILTTGIKAASTAVQATDVAVKGATAVVTARKAFKYMDVGEKLINHYNSEMFDDDVEEKPKTKKDYRPDWSK